ncbi:MAG: N-acetylmuramoyl-L-alanine amidase [Magnetospirillum sp.]|nr:N-acetylmuramoyl-L-alanine amidase [Magnetospirillum sp.]
MDLQTTTRNAFLAAAVPVRSAAKAEIQPEVKLAEVKPPEVKPAPRAEVARAEAVTLPPPEPRPVAVMVEPPPMVAPAAPIVESPRSLVVYSPEVGAPVAVKAVPEARPVEAKPAEARSKASRTAAPIMSLPVPPPLERPVAAATPAMAAPSPEPAAAPAATKVSAPLPMTEPVEPKALPADGKPVVVIDPGHGGVDPGAIGVSGIYEKYITLAVARELKAQLEKNGRYKVYLTRDRDIFIRLRDRVAIARQLNADLFISLHADSVGNPQLKGLSVYTLSQTSSDSEAQALADKENKADLIAGIDLSHESADVANILIDLAQRETMNRSAGFAGGVVEEVGREANLLGNTHRFAGFAVLKAPDVPSVLVEMGYLSNEAEERNLRQPEHRLKLAKSLSRAIDRFFVQGQKARRP